MNVQHGDQQCVLPLYVIERGGAPLFGREWLHWESNKEMQATTVTENLRSYFTTEKLNNILRNAGKIVLGHHMKAQTELDDDAVPKFHMAHPIP